MNRPITPISPHLLYPSKKEKEHRGYGKNPDSTTLGIIHMYIHLYMDEKTHKTMTTIDKKQNIPPKKGS